MKAAHPKSYGKLTIHAEESINSKITTEMILRCSELENKDLFSKSVWNQISSFFLVNLMLYSTPEHAVCNHILQDPFLVISKIVESGISIPICKTEVIKDDLDPTWKSVFLNIQQVGSKVQEPSLLLDVWQNCCQGCLILMQAKSQAGPCEAKGLENYVIVCNGARLQLYKLHHNFLNIFLTPDYTVNGAVPFVLFDLNPLVFCHAGQSINNRVL